MNFSFNGTDGVWLKFYNVEKLIKQKKDLPDGDLL